MRAKHANVKAPWYSLAHRLVNTLVMTAGEAVLPRPPIQ